MEETTTPLSRETLTAGTVPDQPVQAKIGPAGRLFGVMLSPTETFADINRKPTWLVPIIISIIVGVGFWAFFNWRVNPDWVAVNRKAIEQRAAKSGTEISAADVQTQAETIAKFSKVFSYVAFIVGPPIAALAIAGLFALGMMLIQGQTTYKKILSVYAWSSCAIGLVTFIVDGAILMTKDSASLAQLDMRNPLGFAATNLGVFMSAESSPALKSLAGSIDIFSFWLMAVLIIGLAAIAGSKRVTKGKTASIVISLWVVYVLIRAGLATLGGA